MEGSVFRIVIISSLLTFAGGPASGARADTAPCSPPRSLSCKVIEGTPTGAKWREILVLPATYEARRWHDGVMSDSSYKVLRPEKLAWFLDRKPVRYEVPTGESFETDSLPCGDLFVVYVASGGKMGRAQQSSVARIHADAGSRTLCMVTGARLFVDPCPYIPERDDACRASGDHSVVATLPPDLTTHRLDEALLLPDTEYSRAWVDSLALPLYGLDAPIDQSAAEVVRRESAREDGVVPFDSLPAGDFILLATTRDEQRRPMFQLCVALFRIAPDSAVTRVTPVLVRGQSAFTPPDGGSDPEGRAIIYYDEAPTLTHMDSPTYPDVARKEWIEGVVKLRALVDREGRVRRTVVVQSVPTLDDPAVSAVARSKWKPARNDGKPIAVWVEIPVRFALN